MIRIAVVDDHHLVRAGLLTLIDSVPDMTVVGAAGDGSAALDLVAATNPDVVLMDLSMPGMDGVTATRAIKAAHDHPRIVVLTSFADRERVRDAMGAGAIGYVLKDCEPTELLAAIRSAARGHVPLDPRIAEALLPGADSRPAAATALSPRELEVLGLVTQGLANKQIARALGITERTVKAHLGKVYREIGVLDRTSAALWARDHLAPPR